MFAVVIQLIILILECYPDSLQFFSSNHYMPYIFPFNCDIYALTDKKETPIIKISINQV